MTTSHYANLRRTWTQLYHYSHAASILGWDRNAMMPAKGNEARAAAEAELQALMHRVRTDPQLSERLRMAEDEPLSDSERANLREMRRDWRNANALPESLVQAKSLAGAQCEHAWRSQRAANDWQGFLQNFREVVRLSREEAKLLADDSGLSRYDALMDRYEPGVRANDIDRIFGEVKQWLPQLITRVQTKQREETLIAPAGPFSVTTQRAMNLAVMKKLAACRT